MYYHKLFLFAFLNKGEGFDDFDPGLYTKICFEFTWNITQILFYLYIYIVENPRSFSPMLTDHGPSHWAFLILMYNLCLIWLVPLLFCRGNLTNHVNALYAYIYQQGHVLKALYSYLQKTKKFCFLVGDFWIINIYNEFMLSQSISN